MDIKQLRSFVAIVDYQGFSRAAEKLNIAQATVSTHLLQLEKELNVRLVYRTTQNVEVTEAGRIVYKYASQILELTDYVYQSCNSGAAPYVRIGASTIPAVYMLPEILYKYNAYNTREHFKVIQCDGKRVIEGVRDGLFDVGITSRAEKTDGLKFVHLCADQLVVITPAAERYAKMRKKGIAVKELLREPIILREKDGKRQADRLLDKLGVDPQTLQIVARVNDQETVKNMVAGGMGISIISEIAAHGDIESGRVLKIDLPRFQEGRHIYLVYPDSVTSKHHAWNFIDWLRVSKEFFWT